MWSNPQFPLDLVTIDEDILNEKLHILCSDGHDHKRCETCEMKYKYCDCFYKYCESLKMI